MAKEDAKQADAVEQPTEKQLMADLQAALSKNDFKAVAQISRKIDTITKATEKAELDAKRQVLDAMVEDVKAAIVKVVAPIVESGKLDAADGIWFSYDFDEKAPTLRLMKSTAKVRTGGTGGNGKRFDVSTDELLVKHGNEVYKDDLTFRDAQDQTTDKNARYAIRKALLKLEGII